MPYLTETYLRDIVDFIKDAKGDIKNGSEFVLTRIKGNKFSSSIAKRSQGMIMTFPVICTNTLDASTAMMVSKAIERKCVTMLQIILSANSLSSKQSAEEFISQFHQNINMSSMSVDDLIKLSDQINSDMKYAKSAFESAQYNQEYRNVLSEMKTLYNGTSFNNSIKESSLSNYTIYNRYGNTNIVLQEAPTSSSSDAASRKAEKDIEKADFDMKINSAKNKREWQKHKVDIRKANSDITKNQRDAFRQQLVDSDVKKCNELVPSLLIVNYNTITDKSAVPIEQSAIVGVKARLIAVDSYDIINHIFIKANDNHTLIKFIRSTTGEISFVKDFLFAIDKAKVDALSNSRRGSSNRIWKTLEKRSNKARWNKALRNANDATQITSLVITQEEANYLRKNYNINLESVGEARSIMDSYNLLALVIVDESIEVCKFLFDGDDSYETLSFNSLERESSDGMYKKVITLMSKMK